MLKAGVTQATIHQRLRDDHGLTASVASLKRYVAANLPEEGAPGRVMVLRDEADTPPGEEAQLDCRHLGYRLDPMSGKRRQVWAFAMVLACSRHMFVRPTLLMDQRAFTEAHVAAFRFFGGVPRQLVPDNLRTGVDKPDLHDPN
jgi:transposase